MSCPEASFGFATLVFLLHAAEEIWSRCAVPSCNCGLHRPQRYPRHRHRRSLLGGVLAVAVPWRSSISSPLGRSERPALRGASRLIARNHASLKHNIRYCCSHNSRSVPPPRSDNSDRSLHKLSLLDWTHFRSSCRLPCHPVPAIIPAPQYQKTIPYP